MLNKYSGLFLIILIGILLISFSACSKSNDDNEENGEEVLKDGALKNSGELSELLVFAAGGYPVDGGSASLGEELEEEAENKPGDPKRYDGEEPRQNVTPHFHHENMLQLGREETKKIRASWRRA